MYIYFIIYIYICSNVAHNIAVSATVVKDCIILLLMWILIKCAVVYVVFSGNEEAQEIVKMLYDRVSQDDNPDDMGQIRDLLGESRWKRKSHGSGWKME